jgi:predicted  nucleic acid-binding Zn-ribbon protein
MQRCIECGNSVDDTDRMCTACRLVEWRHFQRHETEKRLKREALEAHRAAYLSRNRAMRDAIRAGVVCAVSVLLLLGMLAAAKDALQYEWQTKPAILKAQGVR